MLAGYYTISSGMMTSQQQIDAIGNNLVNVLTPGYKAERVLTSAFEKELLVRQEKNNSQVLGDGTGSVMNYVTDVATVFSMGNLQSTDREGDVAIGGSGFFNIQGANGQTYLTRNGSFTIDKEGYLELSGFGRVLGENGSPIQVKQSGFTVMSNGEIIDKDGNVQAKFMITLPNENATMERLDNGMFRVTAGGTMNADGNYSLVDKCLELANVEYNQEMTTLIQAQRAFQSCSSALQIMDSMNTKAATKIGTV